MMQNRKRKKKKRKKEKKKNASRERERESESERERERERERGKDKLPAANQVRWQLLNKSCLKFHSSPVTGTFVRFEIRKW